MCSDLANESCCRVVPSVPRVFLVCGRGNEPGNDVSCRAGGCLEVLKKGVVILVSKVVQILLTLDSYRGSL